MRLTMAYSNWKSLIYTLCTKITNPIHLAFCSQECYWCVWQSLSPTTSCSLPRYKMQPSSKWWEQFSIWHSWVKTSIGGSSLYVSFLWFYSLFSKFMDVLWAVCILNSTVLIKMSRWNSLTMGDTSLINSRVICYSRTVLKLLWYKMITLQEWTHMKSNIQT